MKYTPGRYAQSIIISVAFSIAVKNVVAQDKDLGWYYKNAPFSLSPVQLPVQMAHSVSISDFGAIPDGQFLNTVAFQKAISACSAAGGGHVIVPAGLWLTGPIELKSNIDLHIERGAIILFTKDHTQYPMIRGSNSSTSYVTASPIYGYDLKNVSISGEGIVDGAGDSWRPVKKIKTTASQWKDLTATGVISKDGSVWWPTKEAMEGEEYLKSLKSKGSKATATDNLPARDFLRPYLLYLVNCENVLVEGVTLRNSPKFVFYPSHCTNLTIRYATIFNEWWAQNGDGLDISACKNVLIYKCNVSVGDDGICMKSSGSKDDMVGVPALLNVLIAECNVYHAHGGFVIGSNTDGGIQNVFVSNCNFVGTDVGIRVKSNAGRGGLVKNIYISNIFMSDIATDAITFDTYYEDVPAGAEKPKRTVNDKVPEFTNFYLSDIYCNGAKTAISITGLPEMPVKKIYFKRMGISAQNGFIGTDAIDIDMQSVKIITPKEPIYSLNRVKNLNITKGYFPPAGQVFIKRDKESSGIKVLDTDLHSSKTAIMEAKD